MSPSLTAKGSCLCGAVTITAGAMNTHVGACHCGTCRKWAGGPWMTIELEGDITFSGEDNISTFESSDWASRGFCATCGTHLFYHLKPTNQYIVSAGLLDVDTPLEFDHQVFIDEKPEFYAFSNTTRNQTGEEVFAQFSGQGQAT